MPPPSLSTTTITRSMPRCGGAEEAVAVVEEGQVADEERGRPRVVAERHADRGRHHAVDAVGAAVGVDRELVVGMRRTTRGRGSASTTRRPAPRRRGGCGRALGRSPGSDVAGVVEHARRWRRAWPRPQLVPPVGPRAAVDRLDHRRCRRTTARRRPRRSTAAPPRPCRAGRPSAGPAATICTAPVRGQPLVGDPGRQRAARGARSARARGRARCGAARRSRGRSSARPTPARWATPAPASRAPSRSARRSRADRSRRPRRSGRGGRPGRRRGRRPSRAARRPTAATPTRRRWDGRAAARRRVPTSGSRNARSRCTGPGWVPVASAWARAARARQRSAARLVGHARARGTSGPTGRRGGTGRWPAARPTSCSSGGRLAVHTSSGTPARSASTTAGCSSTAAVPLVVRTITASPDAAASPRARKPPLRSSWWTWTVMRSSAASASASGVERDPGQTTACSTPSRAHSSTRVAQKVAWRSSGRGAMAPTSDHTPSARIHAMFLHAERRGTGPTLVLVHGFTQTGRCWGPEVDALAADHEVVLVDAPGHGRSAEIMAGLRTGGRLIADQGGEATYLGYSMGARFCLHVALTNPELVRGLVLLGATAGIEDPDEREQRRQQDLATADAHRARRAGGASSTTGSPSRSSPASRRSDRSERSASRTRSTGSSRASSRPAPASRTRRGTSSTASTCPCSCSPAPTTPSSPPSPSAWPPRSATTPPSPSSRAPATPPTSSSPSASSRSSNPGSPATASDPTAWSRLRRTGPAMPVDSRPVVGRYGVPGSHRPRSCVRTGRPEVGQVRR